MFKGIRTSILFGKASGLALKGKYQEAKKAIDRCFELGFEAEILAHAIKGEIECELGNFSEAERSLKIVFNDVEQNPNKWTSDHDKLILKRVKFFWEKIQNKKT